MALTPKERPQPPFPTPPTALDPQPDSRQALQTQKQTQQGAEPTPHTTLSVPPQNLEQPTMPQGAVPPMHTPIMPPQNLEQPIMPSVPPLYPPIIPPLNPVQPIAYTSVLPPHTAPLLSSVSGSMADKKYILSHVTAGSGLVALFSHWLLVALRTNDCAALADVFELAHTSKLTLDDLSKAGNCVPQSVSLEMFPPAITEWFQSSKMCMVLGLCDGNCEYFTNEVFDELMMHAQLNTSSNKNTPSHEAHVCSVVTQPYHSLMLSFVAAMWSHVSMERKPTDENWVTELNFATRPEIVCKCDGTTKAVPAGVSARVLVECGVVWFALHFDPDIKGQAMHPYPNLPMQNYPMGYNPTLVYLQPGMQGQAMGGYPPNTTWGRFPPTPSQPMGQS